MRKIIDWLFLSDQQYFDKYELPVRLGFNARAWEVVEVIHRGPSPVKRMLIWIFS